MGWRKLPGTGAIFDDGEQAVKATGGAAEWAASQLAIRADYEQRVFGRAAAPSPQDRFARERQAINAELERLKAARWLSLADRARKAALESRFVELSNYLEGRP